MIRFKDWTIDRRTLAIHHGAFYYVFNGKQGNERRYIRRGTSARFLTTEHLILSGGRATRRSIFDCIYSDDIDGGPLQGTKQVDVMLNHMEKDVFPKLGCVCVHTRRAGEMWYELKSFNVEAAAQKIRDVVRRTA